jgi:hypothetical protein
MHLHKGLLDSKGAARESLQDSNKIVRNDSCLTEADQKPERLKFTRLRTSSNH